MTKNIKRCYDCRHCKRFWLGIKDPVCLALPDAWGNLYVSGNDGELCTIARRTTELCGPEAKLFEPRRSIIEKLRYLLDKYVR